MAALQTHTYDPFISARGKIMDVHASTEEKAKMFDNIRERIRACERADPKLRKTAEMAIHLIVNNRAGNAYGNSMYADDILYLVCKKIDADDIVMLIEQLSDVVTSGSCPAGRVNRLVQLLDGLYGL